MSSKPLRPRLDRKSIPALLAYLIAAYLVIHLAPGLIESLGLPDWVSSLLVVLVIMALPLAVAWHWVFGKSAPQSETVKPVEVGKDTPANDVPSVTESALPSVAVLPFRDQSSERDLEYLTDGFAEELLIVFSRTPGLTVPSRAACFALKGKITELPVIGEKLQVDNIVTGRVRRKGERLNIQVRLVKASTGKQLWSGKYVNLPSEIFAVQTAMTTRIGAALGVDIHPGELLRLASLNSEAYDLYLRGRSYLMLGGLDNTAHAVAMFVRSSEADPKFVRAWIALARAYAQQAIYFEGSDFERADALKAGMRAVELKPRRAESHSVLGIAYLANQDYASASAEFERAIELDPTAWEAYYNYGRTAYHQGQMEKALEQFENAMRVNPDDYQSPALAAPVYKHLGDEIQFLEAAQEGAKRAERHLQDYPESQRAWYLGAVSLLYLGERDRALSWAEESLAIDPSDPAIRYNMGCFYAQAGNIDRSFECLKNSISSRSWVENDPDLEPIRDDPRYQQLLDSLE
ncbi:MAG: tetratricopeptide repeat protein [Gammaproteobacteria bacterium]